MLQDPFETLGLPPDFHFDLDTAERRFRELSRIVHPDRFSSAGSQERRLALGKAIDLNDAWRKLRDPISRAEVLLRRAGVEITERNQPRASQALLMDFMDLREQLAEARSQRNLSGIQHLAAEVQERENTVLHRLEEGFVRLSTEESSEARTALTTSLLESVGELRYVRRFFDEVRALEEE